MIAIISAPLSRPQGSFRPLCMFIVAYIFNKSSGKVKKYFPGFRHAWRYTKIIFTFPYRIRRIGLRFAPVDEFVATNLSGARLYENVA